IGLAGMDPATEAALKAAFLEANERLSGRWQLLPETQADHIVVDMDSMYGPMSWLRLHASGKRVVGLTSASRAQTDYRLGRPFSADSFLALLEEIQAGVDASCGDAAAAAESTRPAEATAAAPEPAPPAATATAATAATTASTPTPTPTPTPAPAAAPAAEPEPAAPAPSTLF